MTLEKPRDPVAGGSACPEAERLAEYADHLLSDLERATIERHLVGCADCRSAVVEAARFREHDSTNATETHQEPANKVVRFRRRWLVATAALAAAACLMLAVRLVRPDWMGGADRSRPELADLVAAMSTAPTRLVEGRLTGGFRYAPPPSPTRGPAAREVPPDVRIAAAAIETRARGSKTPSHVAALGIAYLVLEDIDRAVSTLEEAVGLEPDNAFFLSDLSAAYLARGRRDGRSDDLRLAIAAADGALRSDPALLEARFNRALALGALPEPDRSGLQEYVQGDRGPWAEEARQRLSEPRLK